VEREIANCGLDLASNEEGKALVLVTVFTSRSCRLPSHRTDATKDIAADLAPFLGPFYSANAKGERSFTALPALFLSNSILQATGTHKGYKMALELDSDWMLWTNRSTFYETVKAAFTTPASIATKRIAIYRSSFASSMQESFRKKWHGTGVLFDIGKFEVTRSVEQAEVLFFFS
jgi:hypothetical protein